MSELRNRLREGEKEMATSNKYKGHCSCGQTVEASAGIYKDGMVFCDTPNELNHCPTYQKQCDENERIRKQQEQEWRNSMTPDQWDQFCGRKSSVEGECWKCGGDGKYHFASGAVGICYQCNGTGKE